MIHHENIGIFTKKIVNIYQKLTSNMSGKNMSLYYLLHRRISYTSCLNNIAYIKPECYYMG